MTPATSVVITNHDYGPFVAEAIESVLAQTAPTELVVVDDGSTDGSRELIGRYADRARVILQPNAGQAAAMNAGFAACSGELVCFLDADDRLAPTAMAAARAVHEPGVSAVHWRLREIDAQGRPTGTLRPREAAGEGDLAALVVERGPDCYPHPPTSGSAWSRAFLEHVMPLPELERELGIGSASADALLATLAPLHGRLARAPDGGGDYRLHAASDYSGTGFAERLRRDRATHEARCRALEAECERLGIAADPARWRRDAWVSRLDRAAAAIDAALPPGEPFVLIDDAAWAMDRLGSRDALPFPERDGLWWGPPADDRSALAELDRARADGVRHVVVGWPALWWLDFYGGLGERLRAAGPVLRSDDVLIVDLAGAAA